MIVLVIGLVLFLGAHSVRIAAPGWRDAMAVRLGEGPWKGLYSLVSAVGLVLIVWGYGAARQDPLVLWTSPTWLVHVSVLLNLVAFAVFGAYLAPAGRIKAWLGHPMVLAVKTWAFAHLLANGTLADLFLFGSFLAWAVANYAASRRRERALGTVRVAGPARNDAIAIALGVAIWVVFVWFLHDWLIGVSPIA